MSSENLSKNFFLSAVLHTSRNTSDETRDIFALLSVSTRFLHSSILPRHTETFNFHLPFSEYISHHELLLSSSFCLSSLQFTPRLHFDAAPTAEHDSIIPAGSLIDCEKFFSRLISNTTYFTRSLKRLTCPLFDGENDTILKKYISQFVNLESLELATPGEFSSISQDALDTLPMSIRSFKCEYLNDHGLEIISNTLGSTLEELDLSFNTDRISADVLARSLASTFKRLRSLQLQHCSFMFDRKIEFTLEQQLSSVSSQLMSAISTLCCLEHLNLDCLTLDGDRFVVMTKMDDGGEGFSGALGQLTRLRTLNLNNLSGVSDEGLCELFSPEFLFGQIARLEEVQFSDTAATVKSVRALLQENPRFRRTLKKLNLCDFDFSDEDFSNCVGNHVEDFANLEELVLHRNDDDDSVSIIKPTSLIKLAKLPCVKVLKLNSAVNDEVLIALGQSPTLKNSLRVLSIGHSKENISAKGLEALRGGLLENGGQLKQFIAFGCKNDRAMKKLLRATENHVEFIC